MALDSEEYENVQTIVDEFSGAIDPLIQTANRIAAALETIAKQDATPERVELGNGATIGKGEPPGSYGPIWDGQQLRVYHCPNCYQWHLTSKKG